MLAGRKLLVADDSPYYQTVLGLTFIDEGMVVATAGDGRQALAELEQSTPDVILASVSLPVIGGYELCERVKQSERFGYIPVMLLVGLHETFDQAEARRVGADDVVTKPFQSIRQLVSRVGSLLGGTPANEDDHSTLGLNRVDAAAPEAPDQNAMAENNVTVFVEAPTMTGHDSTDEPNDPAGSTCAADVELQTADTQRLEPIDAKPASQTEAPIAYAQDDTIEMKPAIEVVAKAESPAEVDEEGQAPAIGTLAVEEEPRAETAPSAPAFNEALLDLDDFNSTSQRAVADDLVLDLDYEEPVSSSHPMAAESALELDALIADAAPAEAIAAEPAHEVETLPVAELNQWAIVPESPAPDNVPAEKQGSIEHGSELSPEAIDAIARRAVELLSEKVVREIAWEVVPELAELLIKKKLAEQK